MDEELHLAGGNASGAVVRVGSTVRKPWTESSKSVHAFMEAVRAQGVDVPAPLGRDEHGRQVIEFVPGQLAMHTNLTLAELRRVGAIVRAIHDASADFVPARDAVWDTAIPAPGAEMVCHNDLAPWNLIVGERWVFIRLGRGCAEYALVGPCVRSPGVCSVGRRPFSAGGRG